MLGSARQCSACAHQRRLVFLSVSPFAQDQSILYLFTAIYASFSLQNVELLPHIKYKANMVQRACRVKHPQRVGQGNHFDRFLNSLFINLFSHLYLEEGGGRVNY